MKKTIDRRFGKYDVVKRSCLALALLLSLNIFSASANGEAGERNETVLQGNEVVVTGKVTDKQGFPVPGVTVLVKGTTTGTITDMDGNYNVKVSSDQVLVFSFIGMETKEIEIKGKTTIHVVMADEAIGLSEVVAIGFGSQKKVNVTGAVSTVNAEVLESRPVQNVAQALQGVIPGLNFSNNNGGGTLDNTLNVNIRGKGSLTGDDSPLVLIDGVEGNMNAINPQDIESVTVLKDAGASAIYGARAAFGVIMVKTKNGQSGKTKVSYSGDLRFADAAQVPEMLDSYKFAMYFNEAARNSGQNAVFAPEVVDRIIAYQKDPSLPGTVLDAASNRWKMYTGANANTDWFAEMYRNWAPSKNHNLSLSGGNEKITYLVSGGLLDQQGLIRHGEDRFYRYSLNSKISAKLSDWATLNFSNRWIREEYQRPTYMTGLFFHNIARRWPVNPVYDPNGFLLYGNEIQQMEDGGKQKQQKDYVYQQAQLVLEPIANWKIFLEGNYNTVQNFTHWEVLPVYGYDGDGNSYAASWNGGAPGYSEVAESVGKENYMSTNIYTDYTKTLDAGHNFKVMAGMNADMKKTRGVYAMAKDLITPSVPTLNTTTDKSPRVSGGYSEWASLGYFGRFNYNFQEKYLFEANFRYDGASRFIGDKRWGSFPSFSAGWNIAKESFFGSLADHIGNLKVRAAWGRLGNMKGDNWYPFYLTVPFTPSAGSWMVDGAKPNVASAPGIVTSLMTWEKVESYGLGLDWSALNNRLIGSFDLFTRTTRDMVGPAPELSDVLGVNPPDINNTDMESKGWELELSWRDKVAEFSYGVRVVLSDDRQKVLKYPNASYSLGSYYNNRPVGDIWGYTTVGIAKSSDEMNAHLANVNQSAIGNQWDAGDIMYADLNGDGKINSGANTLKDHGDLSVIGNNTPRYKYGVTLDCAWKGLDFSMFIQGVGKRDYMLSGPYFWGAQGGMWQSAGFKEHWDFFRAEDNALGANLDAYFPRPLFTTQKNQQTQTRYLQDASYVRLKNIQLGYKLPGSWLSKVKLSSVRFYVSADNLLTISDITGIFDPELLGGDWGAGKLYPLSKTISCGVNINF